MITTVLCYSATSGSFVADYGKPCRIDMGNVGSVVSSRTDHYYVQGDTQDETIAFLAGCAHADETQLGSALLARAVVVEMLTHGGTSKGIHRPCCWCATSQAEMFLPR